MTKQDIQQLINKYEDGLTSNAEERTLREFFGRQPADNLPKEWRVYKALFTYTQNNAQKPHPVSRKKLIVMRIITSAAACAAFAIIIATLTNMPDKDYAVIDGKKITNQSMIAAEAEAALQAVTYTDNDAFEALGNL